MDSRRSKTVILRATEVTKMMKHAGPRVQALMVVLVMALSPACAELEKEKLPLVVTQGPHQVLVAGAITLSASTENAADTGYTFTSSNPAIAAVIPQGIVTGVAPGEALITVTGVPSGATATHPVVVVAPTVEPVAPDTSAVPYFDKWKTSAHADVTAEAFVHWNADGAVPSSCARCHSSEGFIDYIGGDGTVPFQVDKPAPIMSVVTCKTCHNEAADQLTQVTFPSGVTVSGLGPEARCMTCHQGRASGQDVQAAIAKANLATEDTVSDKLGFLNIHYYPAAATLYAGVAKGGFQYEGQAYDVRFRHVEGYDTCIGCHDAHALEIKYNECVQCHAEAKDLAGVQAIRMYSSQGRDYDGDGNVAEGLASELFGLRDKLLAAIQAYAREKTVPTCYQAASYPYWFKDTNNDGLCGADEASPANGFKAWTPRLLKAAYNYQMASQDPGAFAHNAKYIIELMHDSVQDLNGAIVLKIDMSKSVRNDLGHFNGSSEAARNWDENDEVTASCSRCHGGAEGFRFFTQYGVGKQVQETANGLECSACHTSFGSTWDVLEVASVTYPSGVVRKDPGNDNLCSGCHSGRAAKPAVDATLKTSSPRFINPHYLPAAATKLGSEVKGGYEYEGKAYAGPLTHMGGVQCTSCHDPIASQHSFLVEDAFEARCRNCHADALGKAENIRLTHLGDYDGDGNAKETLRAELEGLAAQLLAAMQAAATPKICYGTNAFPYWFIDTNGNGSCEPAETTSANGYKPWSPALLKAAYNYQLHHVEPGVWAHNFSYMGQLLYDSIEDVGGNVTGLSRP